MPSNADSVMGSVTRLFCGHERVVNRRVARVRGAIVVFVLHVPGIPVAAINDDFEDGRVGCGDRVCVHLGAWLRIAINNQIVLSINKRKTGWRNLQIMRAGAGDVESDRVAGIGVGDRPVKRAGRADVTDTVVSHCDRDGSCTRDAQQGGQSGGCKVNDSFSHDVSDVLLVVCVRVLGSVKCDMPVPKWHLIVTILSLRRDLSCRLVG
jgi:hypothetical protein